MSLAGILKGYSPRKSGQKQSWLGKFGGEMVDERGYPVARNRQSIGKYISGKMKPTAITIRKMAKAFGVRVTEIEPDFHGPEHDKRFHYEQTKNGNARLTIDALELPLSVVASVWEIVEPYSHEESR